ncbi:Nuclear movement protein [Spraguea lophii 42_110]|uniref:Nuclear movement protein n=1 Tax=Spraguea lophii (strain 42_110) TaxID=1358809 RepID=S7WDP3_SPRLO|nr:Nuclear movement protein [Spraguea lophii 42_110]
MSADSFQCEQEYDEIDLRIPLDGEVHSKDIIVKIEDKKIFVKIKNEVKINSELANNVKCGNDGVMWYIEDGYLKIILIKSESGWWENLLKDGEKINTEKLRQEKNVPMESLDDETRREISKMLSKSKK